MAPELKKWLHAQPTKRDWKKAFKRGGFLPSIAIERIPKLKGLVRNEQYMSHMDGYQNGKKAQ